MPNSATQKTVEDLVTRSRLGDQIASSTLVVIGQEAAKGQSRAIEVKKMALDYISKHPQEMQGSVVFGIDTPEKELVIGDACLLKRNLHSGRFSGQGLALLLLTLGEYSLGVLTHGPTLLVLDGGPNPIVESVRSALTSETLTDAFDWGNVHSEDTDRIVSAANSMSDEEKKALQLGMIIGRARRLQAVADPAMPLAILCANTAWELGE